MRTTARDALSDRAIWILVGTVFLCVLLIIVIVNLHDKEKPESPQAVAAAAFNQLFSVNEWKPGMGAKPFMYHPAGFKQPVWRPLPQPAGMPTRMTGSGLQTSPPGAGGMLNSPPGTNGGWTTLGKRQP